MAKRSRIPREYPVTKIINVHDGDTIRMHTDVGFDFVARKWIRFRDVRAPELHEDDGPKAKQELVMMLNQHAPDGFVALTTFWTPGSYKEINEEKTFIRYVGDIVTLDHVNVNQYMLSLGYVDQGM